jgi:catechol 2,3-dioxygenase-like lactoylglutathione lyase family enzyme
VKLKAVVETAIYVDDLQAAETFYKTVLGLPVIGTEPGRHVFFQVGEASVLLAFLAEATPKGDPLPPHGATGPGHFALGIEAEAFDAWRKLLQTDGVSVEKEIEWPRGGNAVCQSTEGRGRGCFGWPGRGKSWIKLLMFR